MKLYDTGVYLLNGQKIVPENQADFPVSKAYTRPGTGSGTAAPTTSTTAFRMGWLILRTYLRTQDSLMFVAGI